MAGQRNENGGGAIAPLPRKEKNMDTMSIVLAINKLAEVNERIAIALEESNQLTKKIMER